jgi:predicted transcriptional regulator
MVRRSRLEIIFDVLEVISRGVNKPTRIMYKTNLSWTSLHEVFDLLIGRKLIRVEDYKESHRYYITDAGKEALGYHKQALSGLVGVLPDANP